MPPSPPPLPPPTPPQSSPFDPPTKPKSLLTFHGSAAFLALLSFSALLLTSILSTSTSSSPASSSSSFLLQHFSHSSASATTTSATFPHNQCSPEHHQSEHLLFEHGTWVYDDSYPLYTSQDCPFIDAGFRCSENGRPDLQYLNWRWQPSCSNMTRFSPEKVLESLRDGRVVFVGDSIGRNQWESFICLMAGAVKDKSRIYEENGEPITKHTGFLSFRFQDYNCTIEYYRSPFLVPQTRPPPDSPTWVRSVLRLDTIDWSAPRWLGARILVFNAGHWWNYEKTIRGGCYFAQGGHVNTSMVVREAYETAIETWGRWIEQNIDTRITKVFFRSYSSVHFRNGTWRNGGQCHEETEPVTVSEYDGNVVTATVEAWATQVVRKVLRRLSKPVQLLDVSHLTDLRKDGHPSLWYQGAGKGPAPKNRQDCSHWCLPGVPDTWNLLLVHLARLL